MDETQRFLHILFENSPGSVILWTLPGKRVQRFTADHLDDAAAMAQALAADCDVYVGCALYGNTLAPRSRGTAADVIGLVALWADIDVAKSAAAKRYFPNRQAGTDFLDRLPIRPTLRVWSGGGFHAWWCFREPWIFADSSERIQAATLSQRWQSTLIKKAAALSVQIDRTFDLARVLRVPATLNHKYGVPVELVDADGPRVNPSDFEEWCLDIPETATAATTAGDGSAQSKLILHPDAEPPAAKLRALIANDLKFRLSWKRQRLDLKDQTPSAYDQSLASLAVRAAWTDEEITALLIAHRRKHGSSLKLRLDYYARTISRARVTMAALPAIARSDSVHTTSVGNVSAAALLRSLPTIRADEVDTWPR